MAPLVHFKLHLSSSTRKEVIACLRQAYASGQVRVIRRIHVLLHVAAGQTLREVAELVGLGESASGGRPMATRTEYHLLRVRTMFCRTRRSSNPPQADRRRRFTAAYPPEADARS